MSSTRPGSGVAWFHCFAGVAGDMALASLLDAGADLAEVRAMLDQLAITGWSVEAEPVLRCGIAATALRINSAGDDVIRTFPAMRSLIEESVLPDRVRERAMAAFLALATVEGRLHRKPLDQVHFHELAGYDTIIDIVGTCAALEVLGIDEVHSSAVANGMGMIRTEHGLLPNPPPAVLGLLEGAPLEGRDLPLELTTPTGAALIATLATNFGPMPSMRVVATGYGAGAREIDGMPNCTQVVIGVRDEHPSSLGDEPRSGQPLMLLETNLDDATGEQLADAIEALFTANAVDAWVTPIIMKKGRPGHLVSVLCDLALVGQLRAVLIGTTGSFGTRSSIVDRWASTRAVERVEMDGHEIAIKVSPGRAKVEHDDAARVARATGQPTREVISIAEHAWRHRSPEKDA